MIGVGSVVDIAPLIIAGAHWIGVLILAVAAAWLRSHVTDQAARQTILTAVENGISFAENHLGVDGSKPYTVPVASNIGATALRYVTELAPDAVKRMGLNDQALAKIVVAKMPGIDRTPLDPSTVDQITASVSGKAPTAPSMDDLMKALGPIIQQAVSTAITTHYGKLDAKGGNS
jgi:hypothetical protein